MPIPEVNQVVAGYTVDMLWREHRLIVELDSREFHDHELPFERDRDKDATLLAAGHPVVRVTWTRLQDEPDREAVRLRALLEARQRSSAGETGLEPPTPGFGDRCSAKLSYSPELRVSLDPNYAYFRSSA